MKKNPSSSLLFLIIVIVLVSAAVIYFRRQSHLAAERANEQAASDCQSPTPELGRDPRVLEPKANGDLQLSDDCQALAKEAPKTDTAQQLAEAIKLIDQHKIDEALAKLEGLIALAPNDQAALTELAMLHRLDKKDARQAVLYLKRAFELDPDSDFLLAELLDCFDELEMMREGITYLKGIFQAHPQQPRIAAAIGKILMAHELAAEALPYLESAEKFDEYPAVVPDLALAYSMTGAKDKAKQLFKSSIKKEQEKYRSGYYNQRQEEGRMNLAVSYLNYASELYAQNEKAAARQVNEKVEKIAILSFQDLDDVF